MSGSITPTTPNGAQNAAPKGQVVQIVSLPEGLQNNARAIRLEGDVIAQNQDGSVRVRTPQGDIDMQVRGRQPPEGAKVEVDIPAGSPPKNATIRPAPPPPAPQSATPNTPPPVTTQPNVPLPQTPVTQQPPPPAAQQPAPAQAPAPAAPAEANVTGTRPQAPPAQQPPQTAAPAPDTAAQIPVAKLPPLPPLQAGQTVQMTPLPAMPDMPASPLPAQAAPQGQGQGQAQQTLQTQPALPLSPSTNKPDGTAAATPETQKSPLPQKAQGGLISNLLQAVKSVLPASPALAPQPATLAVPPNAITPPPPQIGAPQALQANIVSSPLLLPAKIMSITTPSGQTMFAPNTDATTAQTPFPTTTASAAIKTGGMTTQILQPPQTAPFTVTVSSVTPQNQPVIPVVMNPQTGETQNFVIKVPPATLPVGSQITLQPQPLTLQANIAQAIPAQTNAPLVTQPSLAALPPAWRNLLPPLQPLSVWPVMDDLFQSFYQATPQAAQILGRIIPSPASAQTFGPALLLFAAAAKSGGLENWLGEKKLDMIQKLGKGEAVSRLSAELSSLSQNNDAPATDWKSYPFPLLHQNEISKVMFHVRQEPEEEGRESNEKATRFVMDVSLNRMGEVQLDATVRGKQVNLIVRTQNAISLSMQDAMRTAYATALDNTDIYGDIGFQSDINNFVQVIKRDDALASA